VLNAQIGAKLSFTNPTIVGNKLRVNINIANTGTNWYLGSTNIRFYYTTTALANPTIYSDAFQAPDFTATNTQGTNLSTGYASINTELGFTSQGIINANSILVTNGGADLITVEWTIINPNASATLSWGGSQVNIQDNGNLNPTGSTTGGPKPTVISNLVLNNLTIPNLNIPPYFASLSFINPTVSGNKFRATLRMEGGNNAWKIGDNNLRFTYPTALLSNPTVYSDNFVSPDFATTNLAGSNISAGFLSVNTTLNNLGTANTNSLTVNSSGVNLAIIEWDIISTSSPVSLQWVIQTNGTNPATAIFDNGDLNPNGASGGPQPTVIGNITGSNLAYNLAPVQTLAGLLSFSNPKIVGNKFRANLHVASNGANWYMGSSNLRINYSTASLSNPTIISDAFNSPDFSSSTTNGSTPSTGILSMNTILSQSFYASNNINPVFIDNNGVDVATIEWTIVNPSVALALQWRTSFPTPNPKTAIIDNGSNNPLGVGNTSPNSTTVMTTAVDLIIPNLNAVSAGADATVDCNSPTATLTASSNGGTYLWSNGATTQTINVSPTVTTTYSVTIANGTSDDAVVFVNNCTVVNTKIYLPKTDPTTLLMNRDIAGLPNFPISDPYSIAPLNAKFIHINNGPLATTTPIVLAVTGNNAIVDWVFLELRFGTPGATIIAYTKAALLQADGDIVDMDGISPVRFINAPPGNYYLVVRHRNHLGFRTANTIALSSSTTALNLTNGSVALYGASPMTPLTANLNTMIGGDADSDGSIDAFDTIVWEIQNGLFDDYTNNADYNMDGSVDAFDSIIWELNNGKYQELD
jgi:hypothetical protein